MSAGARMADPSQFALVLDAAEKGWALLTLMCIKGGVDANSADYDRRSVMHVAASTGNLRVVQGLLQVGANVNVQDRFVPNLFTSFQNLSAAPFSEISQVLHVHEVFSWFPTYMFLQLV